MKLKPGIFLLLLLGISLISTSQTILALKDRAIVQDALLKERLDSLLPQLMRANGIDMWIIIAREYNEDPVASTMLPATWLHARRRTIFVFNDKGNEVERLAIARYDVGDIFKGSWNPETQPNQWQRLSEIIEERAPNKIGINVSAEFAHADGLTKSEYDSLMQYMPVKSKSKVVSAEKLAVDWLQIRTENELIIYEGIARISHGIIAEAFSEKVIHPGITTTEDVVWWMRERVAQLGLDTWFHPTVDVQRSDENGGDSKRSFATQPDKEIILPGDLVHCDFGISYLGLKTDMQELAYVLNRGEKRAPDYLVKALEKGNRLQNILTEQFAIGKSGNHALLSAIIQAKKENIKPSIYSHPIGYNGHGAGPSIGMWDMQNGVKGSGDYVFKHNTAYAIELNAAVQIPEWNNKEIRIMLEEQGVFTNKGVYYMDGRQKSLMLIPSKSAHLSDND